MALKPEHASDGQPVLLSRNGPVATVTLNRPRRKNAIDDVMWAALSEALSAVRSDEAVGAVVIEGAGGDFCAGADITGAQAERHPVARMRSINDVAMLVHEMPKPVVAKVTGVAVGAGWNLALGCDLVVCTPEARFSQIFARRALSVDFGGSWLLPRLVGIQQAKRLVLLAEFVDAVEAHELGLVTWIKQADEISGFAAELAGRLAAGPPVAAAQSKALLDAAVDQSFREALDGEARAQAINFATDDAAAAFEAFRSKNDPTFTGKWSVP